MKRIVLWILALAMGGAALPGSAQSLAEAARKAREQKKEMPQAKRVFTNDDIPSVPSAGVSTVGTAPPSETGGAAAIPTAGAEAGSESGAAGTTAGATQPAAQQKTPAQDEAEWRKKFTDLRAKIASTEKEIDILQREWNLKLQQYYSDPNVAMKEQNTRGDINDTKSQIDAKKQELETLKQQLADLEDALRKAGGPASWARE